MVRGSVLRALVGLGCAWVVAAAPPPARSHAIELSHSQRSASNHRKKKTKVRVVVMTLGRRQKLIDANKNVQASPRLHEFRSVNGYDPIATAAALAATPLPMHRLCGCFACGRWGTIANYLTRYNALVDQVTRQYPFQATIEDDMRFKPFFKQFLKEQAESFGPAMDKGTIDVVRLGPFGEGYLTSLQSAKRIVERMRVVGINGCPDHQMNGGPPTALKVAEVRASWVGMIRTNNGDIARTACISRLQMQMLREQQREANRTQENSTRDTSFRYERTLTVAISRTANHTVFGCRSTEEIRNGNRDDGTVV